MNLSEIIPDKKPNFIDQKKKLLNRLTVKQLIDLWNETEHQLMSIDLATVRGWIMDCLECKDPEAFNQWVDADFPNDKIEIHFKKYY
jgi:hypothetical protein